MFDLSADFINYKKIMQISTDLLANKKIFFSAYEFIQRFKKK